MKKILIFIFLIISIQSIYSQNLKDIKKKADQAIKNKNFNEAINEYQKLINDSIVDYQVYANLGYCYLQTSNYFEAIDLLQKTNNYYKTKSKEKTKVAVNNAENLAIAYFMTYNFFDAKSIYEQLLINDSKNDELGEKIIQCDSAQRMFENPKGFFVFRPGIINSDYPDYCPIMNFALGKIYFTSRRPGSTGGKIDTDGLEFEDIYSVDINNGDYSTPKNMGLPINTEGYEATSSISFDGKTLFMYKSSDIDDGDIYFSTYKNGRWSIPERMEEPVNSDMRETHAAMSPDGKYIYFTTDRKGGQGGLDIYEAKLSADGKWTNARNLGPQINTPSDEEGPFVSPDGNYLYFSSNGLIGMGGFDIFRLKKLPNGDWSKPQNMGFPLNTVDDDLFFVPTNNPEEALYSSKQIDGKSSILIVQIFDDNNSIYINGYAFDTKLRFLNNNAAKGDSVLFRNKKYPFNQKVSIDTDTVHVFFTQNKFVMDSVCKIPADVSIKVFNLNNKELVGTYAPSIVGKYGLTLSEAGKIVYYSAPGYSYDFLEVKNKSKFLNYNAQLDTLIDGQIKIVKYSKFVKDSISLNKYQKFELVFLSDFLKEHKNLSLDISAFGFRDNVEEFDKRRASSIVSFLRENGIDTSRIFYNLSSDMIKDTLVQYTIYDSSQISKIKKDNEKNYTVISNRVIHGVLVNDVKFELNMAETDNFYEDLDFLATYLIRNQEAKIGVYGYTDIQGNASYNQILSQKRADFIKTYLVSKGVDKSQVVAEGHGFSKQIAMNQNSTGQYMWNSLKYNRRVEIEILNQGKRERLFVKPIDVPNQFQINISGNTYYYSINILSSEIKIPSSAFDFDVTELLGVDGLYNYIYGEFEHEFDAENYVLKIKNKYPKSFVFINNYRN